MEKIPQLLKDCNSNETEVFFSYQFEVCPYCEGNGSYVNPDIDSNGITSQEFRENPDFHEDYFSGVYNVECKECKGTGLEVFIDHEVLNNSEKELVEMLNEIINNEYGYRAERLQEIKMGY